jgi:class 3 adenylate cyclase
MATKRIFEQTVSKSINDKLEDLESIKSKVQEIKREEDSLIRRIREGFVNSVVIFIDLVNSTKFKIENQTEPEKWILRVKQFSEIIKEYIENSNGKVVKYIGDEVMGVFNQPTQIDDALSLILRIKNIEENLSEITGFPTQVKIALDYGKVFLLEYEGHNELDPQGTPIDRCARIGKYCSPGVVLSSFEFVSKCTFPKQWTKIAIVEMKGLGNQPIYQYGEQTIEVEKQVEIPEIQLENLKSEISKLIEENQSLSLDKHEMISTVEKLQTQLKESGEEPIINTDFREKSEQEPQQIEYDEIFNNIKNIKKLIHDSGISQKEYGRFLFLNEKGFGEKYNSFEGKTFDDSIEKDLVVESSDEVYKINANNKRNKAIINLINETEIMLNQYISKYGNLDDDDLFEYSFSDADFWKNYLEIYVV